MSSAIPRVYLHGVPGSPSELALFRDPLAADTLIFAPDRNVTEMPEGRGARIAYLASAVRTRFGETPVRLVAFSLGAPIALMLAEQLGDGVAGIDLIAPAAPLGEDDFLPHMAGGPLFRLAARNPALFSAICRVQGLLAAKVPGLLARQLFASAAGEDRALWADPQFRTGIAEVLRGGLGRNWRAYRDEIAAYVAMDGAIAGRIVQPVTLWHGTADNWAPLAMSESLARHLPRVEALYRLEGLSHYSALRHYWSRADGPR